jgi:hypothetical protein
VYRGATDSDISDIPGGPGHQTQDRRIVSIIA